MNHDQKNAVLKTAFDQFNNEVAHLVIVFKSQVALENDKAKGIQITENSQNIRKSILADWNNIHSMYTLILSNAELDSKGSDTAEVLQPIQTILNKLAHNESRFKDHEFQFPYLVAKLLGKVKSVMQKYAIINNPNMNGNLQSSNNNNGPISTANVKHAAKKFEKVAESVAESNLKLKRAQTKATAKEREVLLSPNTFQSMLEDLEISKAKTIKKQLNVQLKSSISSKSHSKADSNVSTIESLLEDNKSIEVPASNKLANQNLDTLLTDLSQFKVGSMEFNSVLQDDFEEPMRNKYTTEKLPLKVEIKQHIDALSHEPNYNTDDKNSINQPVPDQVTTTIKQNELAISTSALKIDDLVSKELNLMMQNSTKRKTCRTPVSPNDENPFRGGTFQASPVSSSDQKATPVRAASLRIQRPKPDKIEGPRSADTAGSHNSVLPIKASVKLFAGTNNAIPEESQQNLQSSSNQIIMPRFSQTKPQIESSRVDHPDKSKTPVLLIDQTTNNESQSKSPKIAFQIEQEPHSKPRNSAIQKVLKVDEDKGMSRIGSADSFKTIIRLDNPTNDYLDESKSMESQDSKVDDDQKIETSVIDKPTGLTILDNYENDDSVNQELNSALYTSPNITSPMELSAFGSKYTAEHVENYLPSLSLGTQMNLDFQNNMDMPSLQRPNTLKRADLSKPKPLDVQTNLTFEITPSVMNGSTIDSTFKANADNSVTSPVPKVNRSTKPMKGNSQDTDELAKLKRLTFQVAQRRQDIASVVFTDKDYLLNILSTFGTNSNALVDNDEDDENMTNLIAKQLVEIPNPSKEQLVSESKKNEQPVNYNKTMKPTESITANPATTAVDARLQERMSLLNNRAMGKPAPPGPPPRNPLDVQKGTTDNLATHHTIKSNTPIPIGVPKSKTNKPENNAGETLEDTVTMGVSQSKVFDPERSNFQYFTHELYEERDEVSYIPIIPTFQVMDSFQLLLIPLNGMFDIKVLDLSIPNRMGRNNTTNHPAFKAFGTLVVSRNHIDIFARNEKVYIKDIGSNSGTFRNNARLSQPGLESPDVELWTGDYIQLGKDFVQGEEPLDSNGRIQGMQ
ncbi:hypothetical protein HDV02_001350 [Globomyces sp. JEL0801]|nr:hypothetical protein HDV02_001350 [Globomyces sp. JEL0801]